MKIEKIKMIEIQKGLLKIWLNVLIDDDYSDDDKLFAYSKAIECLSTIKDMGLN